MTLEEIIRKTLGENATDESVAALVAAAQAQTDTEVAGLKTNQTKNLDQISKLKGNQLPDGFDLDAYTAFTKEKEEFAKKQKELGDKELADQGQWTALKDQLVTANQTAITTLTGEKDAEISVLRTALDGELIENALSKAITIEKGNAFFLMPHLKNQVQTVLQDGKFATHVVNPQGEQRMNDDGKPFGIADLVAEAKANETFALAFPDLNSGSGKGPNAGSGGGSTVNPWKSDTKNITEQARLNRENPTLAQQMKKSAGVS